MSAVLEGRGLVKQLGGRRLFAIEQLRIEAGARYALTGRNGSGKTTLLRILAGLDAADAGELIHGDQHVAAGALPVAYPRAWRRRIVYVHQHPYMFRGSVRDNAAYGLHAQGLWTAQAEVRVDERLAWAGLEALAGRAAQTLSGGEKQRLALVRALLLGPDLLLLDEPTSNLDGDAREKVLALIDDLARQQRALVVVTHDRDLLGSRAFHRLKLAEGRLVDRE